jgi:hypothetical protein
MEKDVALEWSEIEKQRDQGEFSDYGQYEAAMDLPLFREQFAVRAIVYELNTLAEEVIYSKVEPAWKREQEGTGGRGIPKPIWEQPIGVVWKLIEDCYEVRRSELPGWHVYDGLRDMANAFKHRRGFRRFSDIAKKSVMDMGDVQYQATFKNVRHVLDTIEPFLAGVMAL